MKRGPIAGGRTARYALIAAVLGAVVCWFPRPLHAQDDVTETVKFTSGVLPRATDTTVGGKAQRAVMRSFLKQYPLYQAMPFQMPSIQGASMDTGPLMGIASGNPPHAIYVNFRQSSSYINHGFLEPLEILLARVLAQDVRKRQADKDGKWLADPTGEEIEAAKAAIRERVPGPVWPVIYRSADVKKAGIPEGDHVWSIPIGTLVKALVYRKDVFKEAGLDPERGPEDWDELLEYSRKIKTLPGKFGMGFHGGTVISWGAYSFMVSNGVRYMDRDADGRWRAAFNVPEAAESMYFILRLAKEPFEHNGKEYIGTAMVPSGSGADMNLKWRQGMIGMMFTYLDQEMLTNINPELVGIAPIPRSPKGTRGGELNCRMLGVLRETTPAQKIAVMRYIWYITGDEAQRQRTQIYVENGFGRFMNPDLLERYGYQDILRQVPPGWREVFQIALTSGVPEPYGKNTQFIYTKVSEPMTWAMQKPLLDLPRDEAIRRLQQEFEIAAERVNKYMLGELSPQEWRTRRIVGLVAMVLVMLVFGGSLYSVWRSFGHEEQKLGDRPKLRRFLIAYVMIIPALAVVLFWQYLPVIMGAPLALFDYELMIESQFVGIDNFATILYDERFWWALFLQFYFVILTVGLGFWPPIMVAILLDEVPTATLKYFFRTIFYLPTIVSGIIMVFLWRQLYEPSESGFLNQIVLSLNHLDPISGTLVKWLALGVWLSLIVFVYAMGIGLKELTWPVRGAVLLFATAVLGATLWPLVQAWQGPSELVIQAKGLDPNMVGGWRGVWSLLSQLVGRFNIKPLGWVEDPQLAMLCCVIPGIWAGAGAGCIIYLAALKTVPEELVEAASIDGAGIMQKIAYITLPRIKFLILIQLIGAVVGAFKGGANFILAMTGGGPNGATRLLGMDIFERTFMELQYGIGAAMAWILGGLVIVLTAYQLKRMSRAEFRTAGQAEAEGKAKVV